MTLKESMVDYIFLSREVPLPLSALKIIYRNFSFKEIIEFSEKKLRLLLSDLKKNHNIFFSKIDEKVKNFIKKREDDTFERINQKLKICENNHIKCLSYFDVKFPRILKLIKSPPKFIFLKGQIKPSDEKAVAIIGTRNPTPYGEDMAKNIAKILSEKGFTIVSGFARGIDTIAVKSALDCGGRAICVIGSGILNIYPEENIMFVNDLIQNGALISEMFPFDNVTKRALQIRNKITSGLGLGNIFVEGTISSGTKWQLRFGELISLRTSQLEKLEKS